MNYKPVVILFFPAVLFFCSCSDISCTNSNRGTKQRNAEQKSLRLVNWNTETFFDAVKDGTEYSEFISPKSNWNRDAYIERLDRLCGVIKTLDADVYIFEEIENEGIMYDISNRLAGNAWNSRQNWNYACFAKTPGDAAGCAVLSRFPLGDMTVHALGTRMSSTQPPMRPIIEVSVFNGDKPLILFINHWKSKSGGKAETEVWRNMQEAVLARLIAETHDSAVVACGDFNRDIDDFTQGTEPGTVVLKYTLHGKPAEITAGSPWFTDDKTYVEPGSYYFEGRWERIDHFFTAGTAAVSRFLPAADGPWAESSGIPRRYEVFSGTGWSDHLPVTATVTY